ncbi:MAG: glycosyltransferase family 39 protein [Caldilineaceae bacterium]
MNARTGNVRTRTWLILALLFVAAWLPRVVALDAFVTIDERKWLARSANFYEAVSHGDWADTFQREHPGVTVMWAGTLGFLQKFPDYPAQSPGQFAWEREELEAWLKENTALTPLEMLAAGRWWVVLGVALAVAASYLPLRRLLDEKTAFAATLFLAWSPFYVALSRQLHPDGLVASLSFLALLLFLAWLYAASPDGHRPRRYLVGSGIIMGLAWLTKTPAIFLVPTGLVLMAIEWLRPRMPDAPRPSPLAYVLWGAIAIATFVLLWPAMWVNPLGTLWRMTTEMSDYVERHTVSTISWGGPQRIRGSFSTHRLPLAHHAADL